MTKNFANVKRTFVWTLTYLGSGQLISTFGYLIIVLAFEKIFWNKYSEIYGSLWWPSPFPCFRVNLSLKDVNGGIFPSAPTRRWRHVDLLLSLSRSKTITLIVSHCVTRMRICTPKVFATSGSKACVHCCATSPPNHSFSGYSLKIIKRPESLFRRP